MIYSIHAAIVADVYGRNAYGSGAYSCASSTTCTTGSGTGGGVLTNTGIAVGAIVGIACALLVLAIVVRVWRRPARRAEETVVVDEQTDNAGDQPRE